MKKEIVVPQKSAKEYFTLLKSRKQKATDQDLQKIYDNCLTLLNKYKITGQVDAMRKLIFHLETIEKERQLLKKGIDTFVYLSDIKEYIKCVEGRTVKIIELPRYERELPDDIVKLLPSIKSLFHSFFVVFTDYTGEYEKKHKKETDPILFGMFKDEEDASVVERMYYIGDWVDEYCDLTLDKMVCEMKQTTDRDIEMKIRLPKDIQELKQQLGELKKVDEGMWRTSSHLVVDGHKVGIFEKMKNFISRKKVK